MSFPNTILLTAALLLPATSKFLILYAKVRVRYLPEYRYFRARLCSALYHWVVTSTLPIAMS
jgi:hypothetical protein